jgi:hypothetical protein
MEVARAGQKLSQERRAIDELARYQMPDAFLILQLSMDFQKLGFNHGAALIASDAFPDDHIDLAGLILERQKSYAVRALGALTHEDYACRPNKGAVHDAGKIFGAQQLVTQQTLS